jgi:hypothetical protein
MELRGRLCLAERENLCSPFLPFCDSVDYSQNPKISLIIAKVSLEIKEGK